MSFAQAGHKALLPQKKDQTNKLHTARDWQLLLNLGKQLRFPDHILMTKLHLDIVIFSNQKTDNFIGRKHQGRISRTRLTGHMQTVSSRGFIGRS